MGQNIMSKVVSFAPIFFKIITIVLLGKASYCMGIKFPLKTPPLDIQQEEAYLDHISYRCPPATEPDPKISASWWTCNEFYNSTIHSRIEDPLKGLNTVSENHVKIYIFIGMHSIPLHANVVYLIVVYYQTARNTQSLWVQQPNSSGVHRGWLYTNCVSDYGVSRMEFYNKTCK